jgi:phosphatidylserine/phosphatidylglycerophosphate/cardiolipin synthase-like enzyme/uncharacterized membrane protein YdjX (TVP38/TMEM64 family)
MAGMMSLRRRRLFRPGRNCWRLARAERMGVLVDGEAYFAALAEILPQARHSILMLGWEFDSRCRLRRDRPEDPQQTDRIGPLLDRVVRDNPALDAAVLIWDSALIYAPSREFAGLVKMDWLTHPRLRFRLDCGHPIGASHHHKVVVIDDRLAFLGGLDVTSQRWDGRSHASGDPRRCDPGFPGYPPFHDIMTVVTGPAAAALGDLCRERWLQATGERLAPPPLAGTPWPTGVCPLFAGIDVALSRTAPPWDGAPARREVEQLYLDMIAAARRLIFLENQYFTARRLADALAARLAEPRGPEVVVIGPGAPVSLMERSTMGVARARLVRRLAAADRFGRFRFYRAVSGGGDVKIHSKLAVIDDRVLRIGTANLNNRSMGLDSECDLTIEAADDGVAAAIRLVRHDLLAEHLGVAAADVARAEAEAGGIHAAIAHLAGGDRALLPFDCAEPADVMPIIGDSPIPDPDRPMEFLVDRPPLSRWRRAAAALAVAALAAVLWQWMPPALWGMVRPWLEAIGALRHQPEAAFLAAAVVAAGGVLRLPLALPVLAAAVISGPWLGALGALAGATAGAWLHYWMGRRLGPGRVRRLAGPKANPLRRALSRRGIAAMLLLRLLPGADFAMVSLVAGSIRLRLRDFLAGTLIGTAPGIFAVGLIGDRLLAVLREPSPGNIAVLTLATGLVVAAVAGLAARFQRADPG